MLFREFTERNPGPYGLWDGKPAVDLRRVRGGCATWVDRQGRALGWGYLHLEDLERIAREIPEGDVFGLVLEGGGFQPFHEVSPSSPMLKLYLRDRVGIVVRRGEVILIVHDENKKLAVIDRSDWERRREQCIERGRPIPVRMLAWGELSPDIKLAEVGRLKVLSLFALPT